MITRLAICFTFVLAASASPIAAQPANPVGLVLSVQGVCTITVGGETEPAASGRLLYPRERLQCASGAMDVKLGCEKRSIREAPDAVTVAWVGTDCDRPLLERLLVAYGEPGGRTRGSAGILISPTDQHAASSDLVLRWKPQAGRSLTFELRRQSASADGGIWRAADVDGALGKLERDDLEHALAAIQDARAEPLTMEVSGEGIRGQIAQFRLLPADQERELRSALDAIAELTVEPLLRHIGRASTFQRYDLLPEAAAEYEAALVIAPDSALLRTRAIETHGLTGNLERVEQLESAGP